MKTAQATTVSQTDLDRCAQEPVHIIGQVQPWGVLFALSEPDLVVRQVSVNVLEVCGLAPEAVLGGSFEAILGRRQFDCFRSQIDNGNPLDVVIGSGRNGSQIGHQIGHQVGHQVEAQCLTHRQDGVLIVELELRQGSGPSPQVDIDTHIQGPLLRMQHATDVVDLARIAADEFRYLTGFERAIIYEFEEDWSGNVIAESVDAVPVAYLGLRFPASDVPSQVRRLLLVNPLRAISDVQAAPVPMVPEINPVTGRPLDMTFTALRSASPVHIEYLSNMGVRSSLAISIVVEGKLWGMIACHHPVARHLGRPLRSICELLAQLLSSQVHFRATNAHLQMRLDARTLITKFVADAQASSATLDGSCFLNPVLLKVFAADGLVCTFDGITGTLGEVVEPELLAPVIERLQDMAIDGVASCERLGDLDSGASDYASRASGALYIRLRPGRGNYLLLLRKELVPTIVWAGDPHNKVTVDAQNRLHPRASFHAWQENSGGSSRPWSKMHLDKAGMLRGKMERLLDEQELNRLNQSLAQEVEHRKQTELRLIEGADRLALAIRAGSVGTWEWDLASNRLVWDDQMFRLYGKTRSGETEAYQAWLTGIHPEDRGRVEEELQLAVKGEKEYDTEFRVIWSNGETHIIRALAMVQRNAEGQPLRMLGTNWDITRARQAEEQSAALREAVLQLELEKANDMHRVILNGVGEGIYGLDARCVTTFVNPAGLKMLGYTAAELVGKLQHPMVHHSYADGRSYPIQECPIYRALQDGRRDNSDAEVFWRKDGSSFPISYTITPIVRDGRPDGAVVVFREISERKRREAADAANRAKSEFLANMSHEIRTPMNGVLGMIQLALLTELSEEQRHFLEVAQNSGRTLLAIIDDILDISKIEAGKIVIESLEFDLHRALDEVTEIWRIQASAKGLNFRSSVSSETPKLVRGDANRLRQILSNFASNAIKFTHRGEITLDVALLGNQDGKATVRFAVTDTGIGLRPDQIGKLFSPFVQADASTTRKFGGSGLGLAISKHLAELMGGRVGIESTEGHGATFWFTVVFQVEPVIGAGTEELPPATGKPELGSSVPPPTGQAVASATAQAESRHAARILIAEDNATNRFVALAQLAKLGYQAQAVVNGAEAVEALRNGVPCDIILMDCEMPVMDGFEATRCIRALGGPNTPIIALTAQAMAGDRERCLDAGMDDFLSKPVDMRQLEQVLAKWSVTTASLRAAGTSPQAAASPSEAVFDGAALLERLMGDRPLANLLLESFLGDSASQMDTLHRRFSEGDAPAARIEAHALKGSAATVSAVSLSAVALEMEKAAAAGEMERFGQLLPRVQEELERFQRELAMAGWREAA